MKRDKSNNMPENLYWVRDQWTRKDDLHGATDTRNFTVSKATTQKMDVASESLVLTERVIARILHPYFSSLTH
jgi:hypothetical protein